MRRVDPNSEEDYWETIKASKVQLPVEVNSKGEVNSPPPVPHLKVVCISDTHDQLDLVKDIPDGDVLIHAGDLTNYGSERELKKVNEELGRLPHKHKLIVAGNHDLGLDDSEDPKGRLEKYRELKEKWKVLPSDLDVLITHTPALGYLDKFGDERWGCRYLLEEIEDRVKPKFHVFGHVHERYGALSNGATIFINAAQAAKNNVIANKPLIFYIPKK
ncbi:Ser/Thr phosphatase family protein [Ancylostoma caninum]|uniref:Ser/Thr phosphatase family protein n=1 Tax=Ancylostoma caninum TaxID=29170 RepID=A0A368GHB7_ANCCA|nr:Ser/Thr phosphatase family protein [Ancylostoma caninum]